MKYNPTHYKNVYLIASGHFLPGEPVDNEMMDEYIVPINASSRRIKKRILDDNGIVTRHYGIDRNGQSTTTTAEMGQHAVERCLKLAGKKLSDISLLATGNSGADVLMPGFANMLQGQLHAPPMETRSHHGICGAGVAALKDAANLLDNNTHKNAIVTAVEFPSRLFKKARFKPMAYKIDFNAHFLRWMLSDGAGAVCLSQDLPQHDGFTLKLDWVHTKSFSGDYPVCMQMGMAPAVDNNSNNKQTYFMDYPSFSAAEADGSLALRQDLRLLPQLFEVGIHEYAELAKEGFVHPEKIDHFLCHYSSEKLGETADELMSKAGLAIPRQRWFSNLKRCGNTGSASIFIMLSEFLATTELKKGQTVFCFIPESGRFTVSYMHFTVVNNKQTDQAPTISAPHESKPSQAPIVQQLLQDLSSVWHDYRSKVWRTPLVSKILEKTFTQNDYHRWMSCWIPQVREGSKWMINAADHLSDANQALADIIKLHASEEKNDFLILFNDYLAAGGGSDNIDELKRNPGGEALNAYMYAQSEQTDAFGLLGGIYIIEGTGQRIIPALMPLMKKQVELPEKCFRFLSYHGENDINHLQRWLSAVEMILCYCEENIAQQRAAQILQTAKQVAQLYLMQWDGIK